MQSKVLFGMLLVALMLVSCGPQMTPSPQTAPQQAPVAAQPQQTVPQQAAPQQTVVSQPVPQQIQQPQQQSMQQSSDIPTLNQCCLVAPGNCQSVQSGRCKGGRLLACDLPICHSVSYLR